MKPSLQLPNWPDEVSDQWSSLATRSKDLALRAREGAVKAELCAVARRLLEIGDDAELASFIGDRRGARAVLVVWSEDAELASRTIKPAVVTGLSATLAQVSSPYLFTLLTSIYFKHFDQLDDYEGGLFDHVVSFVELMSAVSGRSSANGLAAYVQRNRPELLSRDGPSMIARRLVSIQATYGAFLREARTASIDVGRFGSAVRNELVLRRILEADPMGDDSVLSELHDEAVLVYPEGQGRMFGHRVLEALALTPLARSRPSAVWIEAVEKIAGDPRIRHTEQWRRWWQPVSDEARRAVIAWLSAEDLRLFLNAVEEFGSEEGVDSLERLFPGRKKFLEGLLDTGLVQETRLFLGESVMRSVINRLGTDIKSRPDHYKSNADTAIIYLDCGDFHIVEGSHNFQMWIYLDRIPDSLLDRRRRTVSHEFLTKQIPAAHRRMIELDGGARAWQSVRHAGMWQRPVITFLHQNGTRLDVQRLLPRDDYNALKTRFGIPPVRSKATRMAS